MFEFFKGYFSTDLAIDLGPDGQRVNIGFSPGDAAHPEPYLYVGPWGEWGSDPIWNEPFGASLSYADLRTGADPLAFPLDLTTFSQYAGASQSNLQSQTGSAAGALVSFAVGSTGEVTGIYSNGANRIIGQLALASFTNPGGLQRQGQNLWAPSSNSGEAIVGLPNTNGRGSVSTGTLESSNVDLAQQFTNVILAQRGFQSSSRVITAGDQMLQDLVNIIR